MPSRFRAAPAWADARSAPARMVCAGRHPERPEAARADPDGDPRVYDNLLIVVCDASLQSECVATALRKACKAEPQSSQRKLFPARLVDMGPLTARKGTGRLSLVNPVSPS